MSVGKASIKRAANAETRKASSARGKAGEKMGSVQKSVINPIDSEKLQVVFLKDKKTESSDSTNRPVRITEELPEYLL